MIGAIILVMVGIGIGYSASFIWPGYSVRAMSQMDMMDELVRRELDAREMSKTRTVIAHRVNAIATEQAKHNVKMN